jgi:hypothetical protein
VPDGPGTRRWPGSEVVVKTALGLATGGFTFYLSRLIDQSDAWSIILSVLMGGVVLIVGFLTSFERRLGSMEASLPAHNTEVVSVVGRRLGEIGRAVDLVERSSRSTELLSLLDETLAFLEAEAAGGPALPRSYFGPPGLTGCARMPAGPRPGLSSRCRWKAAQGTGGSRTRTVCLTGIPRSLARAGP